MTDHPCYIAGRAVSSDEKLAVYNPYTGEVAGTVASLGKAETIEAIEAALDGGEPLSRYQRYEILDTAKRMLTERAEELRSKQEQNVAELEERLVTGKRERDTIREEAAELAERVAEAKVKHTETVAEANRAQGRFEQQIGALEQKVSAETANAAQAQVELDTGLAEQRLEHAQELQEHKVNQKEEIKKLEKIVQAKTE